MIPVIIQHTRHLTGAAALVVAASAALALMFMNGTASATSIDAHSQSAAASASAQHTTKPSPSAMCASTWPMTMVSNKSVKWVAKGLDSIKEAKTDADAEAASEDVIKHYSEDAYTLAGAYSYFFEKDVDASTLIENGCATHLAGQLVTELKFLFAQSIIKPGVAPSDGYNSSRNPSSGEVVGATKRGVTGNDTSRKAIQITLPNGKTIWVMARCANIVTTGPKTPPPPPPPVPVCPYNPALPPNAPDCLAPKQHKVDVTPPDSTSPLPSDAPQTTTTPGTGVSGSIGTSDSPGHTGATGTGSGDHGGTLPVAGATPTPTPSPSSTPTPAPVIPQAPTQTTAPTAPSCDPDLGC